MNVYILHAIIPIFYIRFCRQFIYCISKIPGNINMVSSRKKHLNTEPRLRKMYINLNYI